MQNEQQPSENLNVLGGEVEKNSFDRNNAPIIKDSSGSVIINYNYSTDTKEFPHYNLDAIRDDSHNTTFFEGNEPGSNKTISIKDKLNNLLIQKRKLEVRLEHIESEISRIESTLKSEIDPSLATLLHWLSARKHLAEKYGKIALRGFQALRREAEEKGNLDDFYFQIENYLELVHLSFSRNNKLFLQEPRIPPTFADCEAYEHASQNIYREVFKIIKDDIPKDDVEFSLRSKLEDHLDELLRRLQAYF
jgi:hypothetical protein